MSLPLLSLLLLLLLAATPGCRALSCFQCSDLVSNGLQQRDSELLRSLGVGAGVRRCSEFNADDDDFKVERCLSPFQDNCAKSIIGGKVVRGCYGQSEIAEKDCKTSTDSLQGEITLCVCSGDYCNGAALPSPPTLLLLLLPAVLLARLVSA